MAIAPPTINVKVVKRIRSEEDLYPSSDGKPMGETDKHVELMLYCRMALLQYFRDRPDVYIAGNNFLYFEQGNPRAVVSPDCYVVPGVHMALRDTYMTWKENGHLPSFVFEITSRKTRRDDVNKKRPLYENVLRVPEYFLFDPNGDYLKPRLQGYRMLNGQYTQILSIDGRLHSEQLGLEVVVEDDKFRFYDPVRQEYLLTYTQYVDKATAEAQRAQAEAQRAQTEAQRAQTEAQRAENMAEELALLRSELETLRQLAPQKVASDDQHAPEK